MPLPLAAGETPRGRILLFADQTIVLLELQRVLREAGWRVVGPAATREEAQALIERGRLDCALVDVDAAPETSAQVADLLVEAGIPVVLLASSPDSVPPAQRDTPMVAKPWRAGALLDAIGAALRRADDAIVYPIAGAPVSFPRVFPQL
jgi:CheY-like chemotaxis protein